MSDHDRMEDAVAAYALDACDEEERDLVRVHVEGCPSCRALLRRLERTVDVLPLATDVVQPPERLRQRILAAAAASPPGLAAEPAPVARIIPLPTLHRQPVAGREGWRRWARRPLLGIAVGAVAVALAALTTWNVLLNRQLEQPPVHYTLNGTGTLASASGAVVADPGRDEALVAFSGLPQPQTGHVYELWLIDASGRATPAGVFKPNPAGGATVQLKHDLHGVTQMAVTQEEGPTGSLQPSQKPELAGQVGG